MLNWYKDIVISVRILGVVVVLFDSITGCVGKQERLLSIDHEVAEEEARQREEAIYKKQRIDSAEQRRNAPVNDSEMVDEMFGFMDTTNEGSQERGTNAFSVSFRYISFRYLRVKV